jgi:glycosyltransferase involved in cell wall biosynthesis
MEKPLRLQILIPTMPGRQILLARLFDRLLPQLRGRHDVGYFTDDHKGSIGAKRQRMMETATADYVAFVDDDDLISADYIDRVMRALATSPDCVGITMHVTMDGRDWHPSPIFRHSLRFAENWQWRGQDRTPHHLCPLRRELAVRCRFPDLMWGEDYNFAQNLLQHLKTEEWSGDEPIYFYNYVSKKGDPPVTGNL